MPTEKSGKMGPREAGRLGGQKTASTHGREFYEQIGKMGGEKVAREKGPQFYSQIGRKGGETVSKDHRHMSEIGRKGGEAPHERRGVSGSDKKSAA